MTEPPLTDDELARIEDPDWIQERPTETILRLVAEVRRLRSDGWLEQAAGEIAVPDTDHTGSDIVAILKKHRDD